MAKEPKSYEIKDPTGKVIGAAYGDAEWVERQMAAWRRQGIVSGDYEVKRQRPDWLRVIDGEGE